MAGTWRGWSCPAPDVVFGTVSTPIEARRSLQSALGWDGATWGAAPVPTPPPSRSPPLLPLRPLVPAGSRMSRSFSRMSNH